jgi:hypothetical protein
MTSTLAAKIFLIRCRHYINKLLYQKGLERVIWRDQGHGQKDTKHILFIGPYIGDDGLKYAHGMYGSS